MVQPGKNWSQILGEVLEVREAKTLPGYLELKLRLDEIQPVEGYADMLAWAKDKLIEVNVPHERVQELSLGPGSRISGLVRVAGPGNAIVDPESLAKQ